jgi:hypothetical protein
MKSNELFSQNLSEGGKVFKTPTGQSRTTRIPLRDIPRTLDWLESVTELPMHHMTLGSVGKKASSGDLDIVIDSTKITKSQFADKLKKYAEKHGLDPDQYVKLAAEVHFLTPIGGDSSKGFVQTDFFFHENPQWMKFSMHSAGDASQYSGAERNQLMSSIAKALGMKYSWQRGLLRRDYESVISQDPDVIAQKLLGPRFTAAAFDSVESIQRSIKGNTQIAERLRKLVETLRSTTKLDSRGKPILDIIRGQNKQKTPSEQRKSNQEAHNIIRLTGVYA